MRAGTGRPHFVVRACPRRVVCAIANPHMAICAASVGSALDALRAVQRTVELIWSAYGTAAEVNAAAAEASAAASLRSVLLELDPQRKRVRLLRSSDRARVAVDCADARSLYDALVFELQRRMSVARRRVGAFRAVEHRFHHQTRCAVSATRCSSACDEAGDVLVDFAVLRDRAAVGLAVRAGARRFPLGTGLASAASAWTLDAHPGFVFIEGALGPCAQLDWARLCMGWAAADDAVTNQQPLVSTNSSGDTSSESGAIAAARGGGQHRTQLAPRAAELTWATLGLHWDWERRRYIETHSERGFANALPREMAKLGVTIAGATGHPEFFPEAAILNFYTLPRHARMGGHRDDGEDARAAPVISVSVGHAAVFVLGNPCDVVRDDPHTTSAAYGDASSAAPSGESGRGASSFARDDVAHAILIRSGDVVILGGASRLSRHGVAAVLPRHEVEIPALLSAAAAVRVACAAAAAAARCAAGGDSGNQVQRAATRALGSTPPCSGGPVGVSAAIAFLSAGGRVNANIRQHCVH